MGLPDVGLPDVGLPSLPNISCPDVGLIFFFLVTDFTYRNSVLGALDTFVLDMLC